MGQLKRNKVVCTPTDSTLRVAKVLGQVAMNRTFLPPAIAAEYQRQADEMGWPGIVPAYCEFPRGKKMLFAHWENLTVAICEQVTQFHIDRARKAIATWRRTKTIQALRKAGKAILYARIYAAESLHLQGCSDVYEDELPFTEMTDEATPTT